MRRQPRIDHRQAQPAVTLGSHRIAVGDIAGRRLVQVMERDTAGAFCNAMLYLLAAVAFLLLIVEGEWSGRFIIAIVFFAVVGLMALSDVLTTKPIVYYRLLVETRSGDTIVHATPDARALAAFDAAVARAIAGQP